MQYLNLSSKAETLENLSKIITKAKVLPLYKFSINEFNENKIEILNTLKKRFENKIIVRSSSVNEDTFSTSNAGLFDSVINVDCNNIKEVEQAIAKVIISFGNNSNEKDLIFIQPLIENVTMSGVIFSADLDTLSSYYIINYDESGSTNSVTSGNTNNLKNVIIYKQSNILNSPIKIQKIIDATKECELIFQNNFLDIEFAFKDEELYIFQVRAIVTENKENLSNLDLSKGLFKLYNKIKKLNAPHPNLLGDKTIFGVMPDWNPAEIIGIRPKRLALSLYKKLITDDTWAYQRDNYGYRNLRSHPLLVSFLGIPYIDVRVSFNSFIPKKLENTTATKLINYYLNKLSENKNHHDKIEFEIIFSCYYFGIEKKLNHLSSYGFNNFQLSQLKSSLLELTNNIINPVDGLYKKDLKKINTLKIKFDNIVNSKLSLIDKIYWMVEDVKRYGTLPFAGIARAAFIAIQFLNSLVDKEVITKKDYSLFLNSLNTITKQLSHDFNTLSKKEFLKTYGHLRPGTYDITSLRYDEAYEIYFDFKLHFKEQINTKFEFSNKKKKKITTLIHANNLNINYDLFIKFIKESIEGREYSKFIFTNHVSQILKYIEEFGSKFGFSREDLAYINIEQILNLYATLDHRDVNNIFQFDIDTNKKFYKYTKSIKLPELITNENDIYNFTLEHGVPNFITLKDIRANVITEDNFINKKLENKIICIKSADPGYDYLFAKNIGGLITCYGGANSHMAIRCAELGIPAVIGCGENDFEKYKKANTLSIDALNKQVKILS